MNWNDIGPDYHRNEWSCIHNPHRDSSATEAESDQSEALTHLFISIYFTVASYTMDK